MRPLSATKPAPVPHLPASASNGAAIPQPDRAPRRRRRRILIISAAAVAATAVTAMVVTREGGETTTASASAGTTTAEVVRKDLVVTDNYDGDLGYGEATAITAGRSGVVTGVAGVATVVNQGDTLYHVDLQPAVLLYGEVPAFRALNVDSEAGADITQLEQGLVDLGYGSGITVDEDYTAGTAAAVKRWETALGRFGPDGVVSLGDVVFRPGAVRVSAINAPVGTQVKSDSAVLEATSTAKVVTASVSADEANRIEVGTPVQLELPNRSEVTGKVAGIGPETASAQPQGGGPGGGRAVTITLDDPSAADRFDSGSVDVVVERSRTENATAVPVTALLALTEGGYAVQVVDANQPNGYRLVGVKVGTYADQWVQVTGAGLEAGAKVVVPR